MRLLHSYLVPNYYVPTFGLKHPEMLQAFPTPLRTAALCSSRVFMQLMAVLKLKAAVSKGRTDRNAINEIVVDTT